jgi:hypothetical protein
MAYAFRFRKSFYILKIKNKKKEKKKKKERKTQIFGKKFVSAIG